MGFNLKYKVLLGFAGLSLIVTVVFGYGLWKFRSLEGRMESVNSLYVPAIKALNQVESSLFLLESDLDKSFQEGILRPKDTLESVLRSRLDFVSRIAKEERKGEPALENRTEVLQESFRELSGLLNTVYSRWDERATYEAALSGQRSDFRFKLKSMIREIDHEMRAMSATVQAELSKLGLAMTAVLGFCCILALILAYWLSESLRPLETLATLMRKISQKGLDEKVVRQLSELPARQDEVGTLARETQKMAASLLDKSKALKDQKGNLERAHLELARQNEELKNTQAKLLHSEKLGLVGRMAAQMAHEIRNPLNALNLHAEILEDQLRSDKSALESLEPLRKEINRLITVTEGYLDLSRGPRIEKSKVQVNEVVEELQDLYQPVLNEKGIYFTCDLGDIPPVSVDRGQLTQVLGNLLKNASEAFDESMRSGTRYIRLVTHFEKESNSVSISVMDNGTGIPQDQQKNIFSPFFTSKAQGTGLGLTFSRQVIEAHGGEIQFDSAPNQGTKFSLKLPAGAAILELSPPAAEASSSRMDALDFSGGSDGSP